MDLYFILYLVLILVVIYKTGAFGLVSDFAVSNRTFSILFFLKSLAVIAFYLVYKKAYGGIEGFDAGKFYHDAKLINDYSKTDFTGYLQLLFGLQDESELSALYKNCLVYSYNWDNGAFADHFYNDNRIVIRLHSVFHFIAFNSYFVHALLNCFLSFVGIVNLYKTLKDFFKGKELELLLILCFFPTLWFYTGAVLKEGLTVFVLGCTTLQLKKIITAHARLRDFIFLCILFPICFLLKPYLLLPSVFCFFLIFIIQRLGVKHNLICFFSVAALLFIAANGLTLATKKRSLVTLAIDRQHLFADVAKGGIFLLDDVKFVRLSCDFTQIVKSKNRDSVFTIKKNVPFMYWEHHHQQDTLYCIANQDTLTNYKLVYSIPQSGSNIPAASYSGNPIRVIASYFYYSLFFPFFINAEGPLQWMASIENLAILLSFLLFITGVFRNKKDGFLAVVMVSLALAVCLLIGATTPNSGAIFRYRSPVVVFILISALYYFKLTKTALEKRTD